MEKEIIEKLKELQGQGDIETIHSEADNLLCQLLIKLGYSDVVKEWELIEKWYA